VDGRKRIGDKSYSNQRFDLGLRGVGDGQLAFWAGLIRLFEALYDCIYLVGISGKFGVWRVSPSS